jgi:hypothetical protein
MELLTQRTRRLRMKKEMVWMDSKVKQGKMAGA